MKTNTISTLVLRLPSRHAAKAMVDWRNQPLAFAMRSRDGVISRSGAASLAELAPHCAQVQRVLLLFAASDVTLLRMQVPPLSLQAWLPVRRRRPRRACLRRAGDVRRCARRADGRWRRCVGLTTDRRGRRCGHRRAWRPRPRAPRVLP